MRSHELIGDDLDMQAHELIGKYLAPNVPTMYTIMPVIRYDPREKILGQVLDGVTLNLGRLLVVLPQDPNVD